MKTTGQYRIISGTFRSHDGQDLGPGDLVHLDPDVARAHAARVTPAQPPAAAAPVAALPASDDLPPPDTAP